MPLEAATGQKPDLRRACVWGSRVWVCIEGGTKLGGRVAEGRWMGVDDDSPNGCRVYWPKKRSVTVERNVYWDPSQAEPLSREGEEEGSHLPNAILTAPAPPPATTAAPITPVTPIPIAQPLPDEPPAAKRIRKPSQRIVNILSGQGNVGCHNQPTIPCGVQLPTNI
ncbi:hypothetical protein F5141DRAFT_1002278, partial [Pisolithus sp. B1]